jgi:hypothetical protein
LILSCPDMILFLFYKIFRCFFSRRSPVPPPLPRCMPSRGMPPVRGRLERPMSAQAGSTPAGNALLPVSEGTQNTPMMIAITGQVQPAILRIKSPTLPHRGDVGLWKRSPIPWSLLTKRKKSMFHSFPNACIDLFSLLAVPLMALM